MKQELNEFRIKWYLSSYFSLPAKLLLIQSGIFGPIRAPPGQFDNIDGWSIRIENAFTWDNCSTSLGKPRDATLLTELSIWTTQPLQRQMEKFVQRVTVWHHKACWVMLNSDPDGWILLSTSHTLGYRKPLFVSTDRFLVCKSDSVCIKRNFSVPKNTLCGSYTGTITWISQVSNH